MLAAALDVREGEVKRFVKENPARKARSTSNTKKKKRGPLTWAAASGSRCDATDGFGRVKHRFRGSRSERRTRFLFRRATGIPLITCRHGEHAFGRLATGDTRSNKTPGVPPKSVDGRFILTWIREEAERRLAS